MILRDTAFGVINGSINSTIHDQLESYQFIVDNGLTEELTPKQFLFLRGLVESGQVHTPVLWMPL